MLESINAILVGKYNTNEEVEHIKASLYVHGISNTAIVKEDNIFKVLVIKCTSIHGLESIEDELTLLGYNPKLIEYKW